MKSSLNSSPFNLIVKTEVRFRFRVSFRAKDKTRVRFRVRVRVKDKTRVRAVSSVRFLLSIKWKQMADIFLVFYEGSALVFLAVSDI